MYRLRPLALNCNVKIRVSVLEHFWAMMMPLMHIHVPTYAVKQKTAAGGPSTHPEICVHSTKIVWATLTVKHVYLGRQNVDQEPLSKVTNFWT